MLLKDSLVGSFELDVTYIYYQPMHSLVHKWIALSNPNSYDFQAIRGHLKIGVSVLTEGDEDVDLTVHQEEDFKDSDLLLPPQISLKPFQIKLSLIKADSLPQLDIHGTIDAYCEINFAGNTVQSSVVVADRTRFSANWYEELYLPVLMPNVSSKFILRVLDKDPLKPENAGCIVFDFAKIIDGSYSKYKWYSLYGAPEGCTNPHAKLMNNVPHAASEWHGLILLKIDFFEADKPVLKCGKISEIGINDYIRDNFEPTEQHELRCQVLCGVALSNKFSEYSVEIAWGRSMGTINETKTVKAVGRKADWYDKLNKKILKAPACINELCDIFVYLKTSGNRVCFARLNPLEYKDVLTKPKWIALTPDKAIEKINHVWEGGYILLRLYVGCYTGKEDDKVGRWHLPPLPTASKNVHPAKLFFNLYQCRDLQASDLEGQSDPYIEVYCNGESAISDVIYRTINPMWYCILQIELKVAAENNETPILVYVRDRDNDTDDDLIGFCIFTLGQALRDSPTPQPPTWRDLTLGKVNGGKLLSSLNFYTSSLNVRVYNIEPECIEAIAEINCLGLRDLTPAVGWLPVNKAFIKFDLNSIQLPSQKMSIRNVETQPGESGSNPTINTVIRFKFMMPVEHIFAPALTCIVYDYLFKGLSQPQIGLFTINLGDIFYKLTERRNKLNLNDKSNLKTDEEDRDDFRYPTLSNVSLSKFSKEDIRKGVFVIYPEYSEDKKSKKKKEVNKPDDSYIRLGFNRHPEDRVMHYRHNVKTELENTEYIEKSPFETFEITKCIGRENESWIDSLFSAKNSDADLSPEVTIKHAGFFKGVLRVTSLENFDKKEKKVKRLKKKRTANEDSYFQDNDDEDFSDIRQLLLKKTQVVVRVYVISCSNLAQKDLKSHSDPYIKIKLAGNVINDSENYQTDQPNPKFYKNFDIMAILPGASRLKIQLWDRDLMVKDEKIGETVIDIEDRYFSNKWRRILEKPIETRTLYHKSTKIPQGSIMMWLEIHTPSLLPYPLDITEKPPSDYEARLIIWQTDDVDSYDTEDTSDLYVRAFVNDSKPKETDTHYRCTNGNGQFNWRMKFGIQLPSEICTINLQIWDRDVLSQSDFIGDACLSFRELARGSFEMEKRMKMRGHDRPFNFFRKSDPDKFWIECSRTGEDGSRVKSGKIEISFELVPKEAALACPVGEGRDEPNIDPYLEDPKNRFQWSLNPFKLINQTCGPTFKSKVCCAVCCVICLYLAIMIGPSLIGSIIGAAARK